MIEDIELIVKAKEPNEMANSIEHVPIQGGDERVPAPHAYVPVNIGLRFSRKEAADSRASLTARRP